ncbi:MAG: hypothetical protein ACLGPL_04840 [Acidobacteriota bacterium]
MAMTIDQAAAEIAYILTGDPSYLPARVEQPVAKSNAVVSTDASEPPKPEPAQIGKPAQAPKRRRRKKQAAPKTKGMLTVRCDGCARTMEIHRNYIVSGRPTLCSACAEAVREAAKLMKVRRCPVCKVELSPLQATTCGKKFCRAAFGRSERTRR